MRTKRLELPLHTALNAKGLVKIHPEMKQFLGFCLYKLALSIRGRLEEEVARYGVVAPQCAMLKLVDKVKGMTQKDLGEYLAIDKATMVRLLDGLESNGLLKRVEDAKDRRAKRLEITAKGRALLEKTAAARVIAEREALLPLTESERKIFRELVAKLTI
jgi:DNA-binding MarR family transcriptional regulator